MAFSSLYTEIISTYVRCTDELVLTSAGNEHVMVLIRHCLSSYTTSSTICSGYSSKSVTLSEANTSYRTLILFELAGSPLIHGILFQAPEINTNGNLRKYLAYVVLLHLRQDHSSIPKSVCRPGIDDQIAGIFEHSLLYDIYNKKGWLESGKGSFASRVSFFTSRAVAVRFALPSFPCATTNRDKKAADLPEGTEYEALSKILSFSQQIRRVYPPGCEFYIISDGHVFSDCMGADDDLVTLYSKRLQDMATLVNDRENLDHASPFRFRDLKQILFPSQTARTLFELAAQTDLVEEVVHPVCTGINIENDLCRKSLLATCAPPKEYIKDLLEFAPDHSITALYRGFARFMVDDLASKLDALSRTGKRRKRTAETGELILCD